MQLYETKLTWGSKGSWHGTRGDAHEAAKQTPVREAARVYLWEVPTAKDNVLRALNGLQLEGKALAGAWSLTPRGGLKEIELDVAERELEDDEPHAPPIGASNPGTQGEIDEAPGRGPQPGGETTQEFWDRMNREQAEEKARKGKKPASAPTQDELDAL